MVTGTETRRGRGAPSRGAEPLFTHLEASAMAGDEIDRLAGLVRHADLTTRVVWSRRWRLEDLVHHVGAVHRWAANLVATGARGYRAVRDTDDWPDGATAARAARWLAAGRRDLLSALRAEDPDKAMWAWGSDQHVRFWSRRMLHETAVHRADAELSLGADPRFDTELARDGVSEFLENLWKARASKRGMSALRGDGETVRFWATDAADRWTIVRTGKGFEWRHRSSGRSPAGDVTVAAPVGGLYLLVWKRIGPDRPGIRIRGDRSQLHHWLEHSSV